MNKIKLTAPNGAHAEVFEYGAHVSSWILPDTAADGDERLYLSPNSALDGSAAIRGGVPIIFPQFSNEGPLPRHGFARTTLWEVSNLGEDSEYVWVDLHLLDTTATRAIWNPPFFARFQVKLGGKALEMSLHVTNRGEMPLVFTCALHTYIRVNDIRQTQVEGLSGTRYRISGGDKNDVRQDNEAVLRVQAEVDRIYLNAPDVLTVRETNRVTEVHKQGFADCVVWNPWAEKCAQLKDMPAQGYLHMLCIEAAQIGLPVQLGPGESWQGGQTLRAV
jgi:glucose-6-phosphate 1-epimerase